MEPALERELADREKLYGGFAQGHFARPAVRALRRIEAGRRSERRYLARKRLPATAIELARHSAARLARAAGDGR